MAYPTRTMDPPYSLVERSNEIELAEELIESHVHGKLDVIVQQIRSLKEQAQTIMAEAQRDADLHKIKCNIEKIVGQAIFLYAKPDGTRYFSLLSPADWKHSPPNEFVGAYSMRGDRSFEVLDAAPNSDVEVDPIPRA